MKTRHLDAPGGHQTQMAQKGLKYLGMEKYEINDAETTAPELTDSTIVYINGTNAAASATKMDCDERLVSIIVVPSICLSVTTVNAIIVSTKVFANKIRP